MTTGRGRSGHDVYTSVKPYREKDDPLSDRYAKPGAPRTQTEWFLVPGSYNGEPGNQFQRVLGNRRKPLGTTGKRREGSARSVRDPAIISGPGPACTSAPVPCRLRVFASWASALAMHGGGLRGRGRVQASSSHHHG